jgi:hypothetical protein
MKLNDFLKQLSLFSTLFKDDADSDYFIHFVTTEQNHMSFAIDNVTKTVLVYLNTDTYSAVTDTYS